jgi:hypothetical protein
LVCLHFDSRLGCRPKDQEAGPDQQCISREILQRLFHESFNTRQPHARYRAKGIIGDPLVFSISSSGDDPFVYPPRPARDSFSLKNVIPFVMFARFCVR